MPLRIEFADRNLTDDEVAEFLEEERLRLREPIKRQTSGRFGIYVAWAKLPNYLDQATSFPEEWEPIYFFTDKMYGMRLQQGVYEIDEQGGTITLIVQMSKDRDLGVLYHEVEVKGENLESVSKAFLRLLSGELEPSVCYVTRKKCGPVKALPSSPDDQEDEKDGALFLGEEETAAA
jgi:hypothetical protein